MRNVSIIAVIAVLLLPSVSAIDRQNSAEGNCPVSVSPNTECNTEGLSCNYDYKWLGCSESELSCEPFTMCSCEKDMNQDVVWRCARRSVLNCPDPRDDHPYGPDWRGPPSNRLQSCPAPAPARPSEPETCQRADQEQCQGNEDCVWMSRTSNTGEEDSACLEKTDKNGQCTFFRERDSCRTTTGCNWIGGECAVAPTHGECHKLKKVGDCRRAGCLAKREPVRPGSQRKRIRCYGMWEYKMLQECVGTEGPECRKGIKTEFGDAYRIKIIRPHQVKPQKRPARKFQGNIELFVDDAKIVTKTLIK